MKPHEGYIPGLGCKCALCEQPVLPHNPTAVLMADGLRAAYAESRKAWREANPIIDVASSGTKVIP